MATKPKNASPAELLERLDTRHNDLIDRIDELNGQIEAALADLTSPADPPDSEAA